MAKRETDDLDQLEYVLPEDSHLRLEKLRDHMALLARLSRPRTEQEWVPEICMAELSFCLELLAEQAGLVLEQIAWRSPGQPAEGGHVAQAPTEGDPQDSEGEVRSPGLGVSLAQLDALDRLLVQICAHGDVVANSDTADLAESTLPLLGQAILDATSAMRDVLDRVERQHLAPGEVARWSAREDRGVYRAIDAKGGATGAVELFRPAAAVTALRQSSRRAYRRASVPLG